MRYLGLVVVVFCLGFKDKPQAVDYYRIPTQTFDPWVDLGIKCHDTITIDTFLITPQITLGEYKKYLEAIKRDSGLSFSLKQFPDSGMCSVEQYAKYFNSTEYDAFPVCGVSWLNAMNYCRWRTKHDSLAAGWEYRLPMLDEWLAAYRHLNTVQKGSDMNRDYADWLLNAMDESLYIMDCDFLHFSYHWEDRADEPPVMRRKRIMGNSFHLQHSSLGDHIGEYGYSFKGYSWVSFRLVKVPIDSRKFKRSKSHPRK